MSEPGQVAPLDQLLLARLLVAPEKGATAAEIKKALEPLVGHRWSGAELVAQLDQALAELDSAGLISRTRKGKTTRGALTPEGRKRTLGMLGLDQLPPKTTWGKFTKTYLAASALGLAVPHGEALKRFAGETGFKAALLKVRFGLPLDEFPKLDEAIDALSWTLMDLPRAGKFNIKAVQAALIQRALGERRDADPKSDPKKEATRLLAKQMGARQSGKDELRLASIRHWVDGKAARGEREPDRPPLSPEPPPPAHSPVRPRPPSAPPLDLVAFARRVVEAAQSSPSGRFGDNKVFIAHVWRALRDQPSFVGIDLEGFKQRLTEANHARLLDLSRADLVEAMDQEDVRQSEVAYRGATFHFVRI
jgi:hypothetical protein